VKDFPFPVGDFPDLQARGTLFDGFASVQTGQRSIVSDTSEPEQIKVAAVTPNLFRLLGVPVLLGRDFQESDGTPQPAPPQGPPRTSPPGPASPPAGPPSPPPLPQFVILSHEFWMRRFGGDPRVVNQAIDLGPGPRPIVVGVLPPGVQLYFPARTNMER